MTMTNKPIIFTAGSIRAILDGRKSMTRRVLNPQPTHLWGQGTHRDGLGLFKAHVRYERGTKLPKGIQFLDGPMSDPYLISRYQPGATLWVKEAWRPLMFTAHQMIADTTGGHWGSATLIQYRANASHGTGEDRTWKESPKGHVPRIESGVYDGASGKWVTLLFMPRWASRLSLIVTAVKIERLQDISEEDAIAEGCVCGSDHPMCLDDCRTAYSRYRETWDRINGKKHPWASNPFVEAVTFEVKEKRW